MKTLTTKFLRLGLCTAATGLGCLWAQDATIRISEADMRKAAVTRVNPEFPPLAKQLRLQGRAEIEVYVDAEGSVEKVQPLNGNPVLTNAAVTAIKKWKFTPFKADGKPAKAVGTLSFDFRG